MSSLQKRVVALTTEWLPWLHVLEVNYISNLTPNHTLQLTTLRTAVSKPL